ncbi:beta-ketoacyl synthase N-terminal-like domain-containing protein [Pseudomonas sp. zfem002]|uniref:beta-ketoacyl synthase N-terminal-like domain-containing protein n=1 Tax=Pseudomonas sp. zfem002 TaxID=3078197 RepID=UPI002929E6D4|nr:beta-ketoacyl synthase N-terminal-like domain-containing protein [Pseudomonas sp. zfem002]MDU9392277.1 beta-ketoacyl synthase N-terminal-like domain-containing protein [Pseudomonas sp. zfem002]
MPGLSAAPLAVVGMAGRFPGAPDLRAFWDLLDKGRDAVLRVPAERWDWREYDSELNPGEYTSYCQRGGFIEQVDCFDGRFFGILPREAQGMDPQQRLFLQCAWNALEDAGYAPGQLAKRRVGVFVGVGHADYPALMRRDGVPSDAWRGTGIALTAIANRVSYCLDLHGPSESIDTACSSSLVALHRASQSLRAGECELAIVGGVNLLLGPELFVAFAKAGMLSHAGHCQTFAASADGYVRGEGVAALVLTRAETAAANGDFIYGEVRGSAQNHGGRAYSFTAPNPTAQSEVIRQAWAQSGYSPRQACLIETHGTGTPLGDPIEIDALKQAVPADAGPTIALGALKSQIGHLEAAAGIASVVKSLLCLQHRQQVGNLHHASLNPQIELESSAFRLAQAGAPLQAADGAPLLAGVSAFGFGGVNAHVVLQAADAPAPGEDDPASWLMLLSAKDDDGLRARARHLLEVLDAEPADPHQRLREELLECLRDLLGLMPASDASPTRLATLAVDAGYFVGCLEQALDVCQLDVPIDAWRGALTLEEVVQRLVAELPTQSDRASRLASLPAVPLTDATLGAIARTLHQGRDAMARRLAFVVASHAQLVQRLRGFLAGDCDALYLNDGRPVTTAPEHSEQPADAAQLARWAAYWVNAKAAAPDWASLYGERPRPGKVPLPGYPWRAERVWYTAVSQPVARNRVGAAQAWRDCWEPAAAPPASAMALAGLLQHALGRHGDTPLAWRDLRFGPPRDLTDTDTLNFTQVDAQWQASLDGQVLLQAREDSSGDTPAAVANLAVASALASAALYAGLADKGLRYSAAGRVLREVRGTADSLHANLGNIDDADLWAVLLATLAGAPALLADASAPRLPFHIRRLWLDPRALPGARQLSLHRQGQRWALDLSHSDGRHALHLDGVELRALPAQPAQVSA